MIDMIPSGKLSEALEEREAGESSVLRLVKGFQCFAMSLLAFKRLKYSIDSKTSTKSKLVTMCIGSRETSLLMGGAYYGGITKDKRKINP